MIDVVLALLPLAPGWADSAAALQIDATGVHIVPAEIAVVGEEELASDSVTARPAWVVTLRSESAHVLYWVDKTDGSIMRVLEPLPSHAGTDLELRLRPPIVAAPPP
jgi:hypothetical protein